MTVYYLFVHKKICLKEKSWYYFHKKLKILKKPFLVGFLGGFFWVFWVGFLMPTLHPAPPIPTSPYPLYWGGVKTKTGADGRGERKVSCDYYPKIGGTIGRTPLNSANLSIRIAMHTEEITRTIQLNPNA